MTPSSSSRAALDGLSHREPERRHAPRRLERVLRRRLVHHRESGEEPIQASEGGGAGGDAGGGRGRVGGCCFGTRGFATAATAAASVAAAVFVVASSSSSSSLPPFLLHLPRLPAQLVQRLDGSPAEPGLGQRGLRAPPGPDSFEALEAGLDEPAAVGRGAQPGRDAAHRGRQRRVDRGRSRVAALRRRGGGAGQRLRRFHQLPPVDLGGGGLPARVLDVVRLVNDHQGVRQVCRFPERPAHAGVEDVGVRGQHQVGALCQGAAGVVRARARPLARGDQLLDVGDRRQGAGSQEARHALEVLAGVLGQQAVAGVVAREGLPAGAASSSGRGIAPSPGDDLRVHA